MKSAAGVEIVKQGRTGSTQLVEDGDVRAAQVVHMHIIAQAGSVRRWLIGSKDLHVFAFAGRGIKNKWNQVLFRVVIFTDVAACNWRTQCEPIYLAPPTTKTVMS